MNNTITDIFFKNTKRIMGLTMIFSLIGLIVFFEFRGSDTITEMLVVSFVGAVGFVIGFFFKKEIEQE